MKVYSDGSPENACILVDYTKKGKRVWFTYPQKKGKLRSFLSVFALLWTAYLLVAGVFIVLAVSSSLVYSLLYAIFYPTKTEPGLVIDNFLIIKGIAGLCLYFLPPMIPAIWISLRYNKYKKTFPKLQFSINKLLNPVYRVKIRKLESKQYTIPFFSNVNLTYEAIGDFSKFLEKVEISPSMHSHSKVFMGKEKKRSSRFWKAVFTFSDIPKKGLLTVDFL